MKRASGIYGRVGLIGLMALVATVALAPAAQAGLYSVPAHSGMGRIAVDTSTGNAWVMAVETYIRGVEGDLFMGMPGLATGHFTAAINLGPASNLPQMILNGNMGNSIYPAGLEVTWYYDETPDQDITNPETFQDGIPIARFRNTGAIQVDLNPAPPGYGQSDSFNIMWDRYELVWSQPFEFQGVVYDLKKLMPDGFSYQHMSGNVALWEGPFITFPYTAVGSVIQGGR